MNVTFSTVGANTTVDRDGLLRRVLSPKPHFVLTGPSDEGRAETETFIAERFHAAWQARVNTFMPWLLSLHCLGQCSAVTGIRPAAGERLFLESYLDRSVEENLSRAAGVPVARREIVEIGNLASSQRGASHLLFLVFTAALHRAGYRWIVFTATRALRNNLGKLGFPMLELAQAAPERLEHVALAEWGIYYQSEPVVMAGSLNEALALARARPLLRRVLRLYRYPINELAARLQSVEL